MSDKIALITKTLSENAGERHFQICRIFGSRWSSCSGDTETPFLPNRMKLNDTIGIFYSGSPELPSDLERSIIAIANE